MSLISLKDRKWSITESIIIIVLALVPLFVTFPYRVNIFLSWEGAYRLSSGQIPYKDFGTPLGYGYWIIPAIFFKIFGPELITLVKAQVFINIISGFAFRSILKSLDLPKGARLLSVLVFVLSYSFFNFWPWYNHTVIVYELVGISFLLKAFFSGSRQRSYAWMAGAAFFIFLSIFTKQDGGGMAFMLCLALLAYNCFQTKRWIDFPVFIGMFILIAVFMIKPLMPGFAYWFNHGQPPHSSRLAINDFTDEIMGGSDWIKGYLVLVVLCLVAKVRQWNTWLLLQRRQVLFALLTLGILGEAAIFQVTSYTPPDNNIFFHSFAFAFIATYLCELLKVDISRPKVMLGATLLVLFWWSGTWWKYVGRFADRLFPAHEVADAHNPNHENVVNRRNFMLNTDTIDIPVSSWVFSNLKPFRKVYMPESTVKGMDRVLALPIVKEKKENIKVLNMTELTPLAAAMPYRLETGQDYPLWYHLGVGMFNRQLATFKQKVQEGHYDLVLFEYAPGLNNFFPFALREELKKDYHQVDTFYAPRRPVNAIIEVYVK